MKAVNNLWHAYREAVVNTLDHPAVISVDSTVSHAELIRLVRNLSKTLIREHRISPGDAIIVALPKNCAHIAIILALMSIGAIYVPIDPAWPAARLHEIVRQTAAKLAVSNDNLELSPDLSCSNLLLQQMLVSSGPVDAGLTQERNEFYLEKIAYVNFTSGTTGRPKGVPIKQNSVLSLARQPIYHVDTDDLRPLRILSLAPPFFDAWTFELWAALLSGGVIILYPDRFPLPSKLREIINNTVPNTLFLTTSLFNKLVRLAPDVFSRFSTVLTGGEMYSADAFRLFLQSVPHVRLIHVYGPTETTTFATAKILKPNQASDAKLASVGNPLKGYSVHIFNKSKVVPNGQDGEILISGVGLSPGYLGPNHVSQEKFVRLVCADGIERRCYRTGDIGLLDNNGELTVIGRIDDQVKIAGHRIQLSEVTEALQDLASVREASALVRHNEAGDKILCAIVVIEPGTTIKDVHEFISQRLPAYAVPKIISAVDNIPIGPTGNNFSAFLRNKV